MRPEELSGARVEGVHLLVGPDGEKTLTDDERGRMRASTEIEVLELRRVLLAASAEAGVVSSDLRTFAADGPRPEDFPIVEVPSAVALHEIASLPVLVVDAVLSKASHELDGASLVVGSARVRRENVEP